MILLAIESSCDETAAAVFERGVGLRSSVVFSQVDLHARFGGVVPELASRAHIEKIVPVVDQALVDAHVTLADVEAVAVTHGPGLVGSLLVGCAYAKSLAFSLDVPLVGVNHIEAHLHSIFLEPDPPAYPYLALLVSGGNTALYRVDGVGDYRFLGQTRDDAVGEAYDKVSKMLGFGYPGGALIDRMAAKGDPARIAFPRAKVAGLDFSYSGLKTAIHRFIESDERGAVSDEDLAASFQEAAVDPLVDKSLAAARAERLRRIVLVGGVAANSRLRAKLAAAAARGGATSHVPALRYCTDNAAMIAYLGDRLLDQGRRDGWDLNVDPNLRISG
ncbi:MAG: tRNA (adenosine(37)-N6)-threonylcarbamoyltransferase complex transferase subunit TsaD [Myxococcales bacterium]|nr:tRNA (adenosine(37)-N6)-threonylcarbamoyltransferase complex transferase subunit TsaD [Myxococcales bacterium]